MGSFLKEIDEIAKMRHAKRNEAYLSILDEQERKWKAFARQFEDIREDGFENAVEDLFPEVYEVWRGPPQSPQSRQDGELSRARTTLVTLAMLGSAQRRRR